MSAPSEADLRRIFERSPIGIYRSTADGRFLYVNPALVAMLGYGSPEEVLALDIGRDLYVEPEERAPLVTRYLSQGIVDGVEVAWRRKDGALIQVRLYGHAIEGEGFDVQVVDVTALRAAEAGLRAQRAETQQALTTLRALMAQLPIVIWATGRDLQLTSIEGSDPDVLGHHVSAVLGGDRDHVGVREHDRALAGEVRHFESEWDDKLWLVSLAPLRDGDGAIAGVLGTAVDITLMRRLERNMQQTQRIESLGVLAGGVAHDFNNLLVAILGNADLALREPITQPTLRHAVEAIRTASLRASELTSQLLAYSGRGQLEVTTVEIVPLVEEMVALLAPTRAGVVALELAPDLPHVTADAAQIRQVVMNLVTNAFDALDAGDGVVRVRTRTVVLSTEPHPLDVITAPPGHYVALEVGDTGVGMDTATRRKIFDPFFTTKPHGHGLGLAAVLGIVRGHRGGLRLFSEVRGGSVFEVLLPVSTAPPPRAVEVTAPTRRATARDKTILVVDDEDMVREVLCHMIEDLGYHAIGVSGGGEALALADRPELALDAAIVDLTMPRMNGRAVIKALRERRPTLPVVLTSGFDRDRVAADDATGFLRKPFRFETLEVLLGEVLGPA
jgi:two-component system, cell cycle sensor histidine kinase and response regulator CckA